MSVIIPVRKKKALLFGTSIDTHTHMLAHSDEAEEYTDCFSEVW